MLAIKSPIHLWTYRQAARHFRVRPETIGDLVRALGIPERPHPSNGRGKALTPDEVRRLGVVLRPERPAPN